MSKPSKSAKLTIGENNDNGNDSPNVLEELENCAQAIKRGTINIMPSIYCDDDTSILWVSLSNYHKLKRILDVECGAV